MIAWSLVSAPLPAQESSHLVWVTIGEAAASDEQGRTRAGRQLFTTISDLLPLTMQNVRIVRVELTPTIELTRGARFCLSSLEIHALDPSGERVPGAPLSVAVRQDQKNALRLVRSDSDICMRPSRIGEYPLRFTSLMPAPDGTTRGAQLFIRVKGLSSASEPAR
ncbi:MAG TPA: hypothetical protein VF193_11310 [Steroidobacter sp.]